MSERRSSQTGPHEPSEPQVSAACFEFLMIELVPMAYRVSADTILRDSALARDLSRQVGLSEGSSSSSTSGSAASTVRRTGGTQTTTARKTRLPDGTLLNGLRDKHGELISRAVAGIGGSLGGAGEEELQEVTFARLEAIGFRTGQGLAERFSREHVRFKDTLDIIKFICKDIWNVLFRKPIDNLKTNHRGVFVLTDKTFRPISRVSFDRNPNATGSVSQRTSGLTDPAITIAPSTADAYPAISISTPAAPSKPEFSTIVEEQTDLADGPSPEDDAANDRPDDAAEIIAPLPQPKPELRSQAEIFAQIQPFLRYPAGVIRGILSSFGHPNVSVVAECTELPTAVFQIRVDSGTTATGTPMGQAGGTPQLLAGPVPASGR